MSKKLKILLVLLIIAVSLFFYLLLTSESLDQKSDNKANNASINLSETKEKMTANYKVSVEKIMGDYSRSDIGSTTISEVSSAKNSLLNLKVPAELKDLHLSLVMAFTKMEDYLAGKNDEAREESEKIINQAKLNYSWLVQ